MTVVRVTSGICGFSTVVRVSQVDRRTVSVEIDSECKQVAALAKQLKSLDLKDVLRNPINENLVYRKAGECKLHPSCPTPCGVIKASEVELGLALVKEVRIEFLTEPER